METVSAIEPIVSDNYLNSVLDVLPQIETLFESIQSMTIKPKALENTPYSLTFSCESSEYQFKAAIKLADNYGIPADFENAGIPRYYLCWAEGDWEPLYIAGDISNGSNTTTNPNQIALRNFSGVVAPYEDAVCMLLAKKSGKKVIRHGFTSKDINSRLVKNYAARGYKLKVIDDPKGVAFQKEFMFSE